ncbi:MAG TPA: hypothetical protein VJC08_02690 [bacterium]|nr:hypothetical protein [bacterium]
MKKTVLIFSFLLLVARPAWALSTDGRTDRKPMARVGYVMMRGVGGAVGLPFEISGTFAREYRAHPRLWPITWVPRLINNLVIRTASSATDMAVFPFAAPFTNDLSPSTEVFDLPEYPWQRE